MKQRLVRSDATLRLLALVLAASIGGGASSWSKAESLYDPSAYRSLGTDRKASRIGDVLTIQVIETSTASSSADTAAGRRNSNDVEFRMSRQPTTGAGLKVDSDFEGGGKTQRSGRLLAQMTASVVDVAPNGDLIISGNQLLKVNDEDQKIRVKGRVRVEDISPGNIVLSTRLADSEITYFGEGELAGRQRPAWWSSFLNWLGL